MPTFRLLIAYDGTGLIGWQRQAKGTSVQGLIEEALAELDGRHVTVTGAGRTDAGVHALGQVAAATLQRAIDGGALVRALNVRLPPAVRILEAEDTPSDFHPRFSARAKTYRYRIWNADVLSPFERAYAWHVVGPRLDVEAMREGARLFEGRHDFASFQTVGTKLATTERAVFASRCAPDAVRPELIVFEITGDGFLRHMVRAMAGTLVEVGRRRHAPEWIRDVIAARTRGRAGVTAPAGGLFLVRVHYEERP